MTTKMKTFSIHYNGGSCFLLTTPAILRSALNIRGFNKRGHMHFKEFYSTFKNKPSLTGVSLPNSISIFCMPAEGRGNTRRLCTALITENIETR